MIIHQRHQVVTARAHSDLVRCLTVCVLLPHTSPTAEDGGETEDGHDVITI